MITQEQDALEYGVHVRSGGWRLGLLAARNVIVATKGGKGGYQSDSTSGIDKVTGGSWAKMTGVSTSQTSYTLIAWNLAAADNIVPHSNDVSLGQEIELPHDPALWSLYYNQAKVPAKPKAPKPAKKPVGKPATPGKVAIAKVKLLKDAIATYPEKKDKAVALGNVLGWSHQEVGRYTLLMNAPEEFHELIETDQLKLAVSQEILSAPNLSSKEKVQLAHKFVSGQLPQVGQGSKSIRPHVAFVQQTYADIRAEFLTTDMTIDEAKAAQQAQDDKSIAAKHFAEQEAQKADMLMWAANFNTAANKHLMAIETYTDGLEQSEFAISGMMMLDPFTTSQTIKTLKLMREKLWAEYTLIATFIKGFGGEVNHPDKGIIIVSEASPNNVVNILSNPKK